MKLRTAYVGTYPPTQCGLATFTAALRLAIGGDTRSVIRVVLSRAGSSSAEVVHEWVAGNDESLLAAVDHIDEHDVVIVQHEYGIFGGPDGCEIVELLRSIETPAVVVLHTVLQNPSPGQRAVLESVCRYSAAVVVQTQAARRRLVNRYTVDTAKIAVIPHGATANLTGDPELQSDRPIVLTWGLIGPGKGLELAIDAVAHLHSDADADADAARGAPLYVVAGQTHPNVLAREGERYRENLRARAAARGVADGVVFDARYRDLDELRALVRSADVVLLPYESREQVTSGVLVEALASGKPVVATSFPHAREALSRGAGLVVPHGDAVAMASALRTLLYDEVAALRARARAAAESCDLVWPAVGARYRELCERVVLRCAQRPRALVS